MPSVNGDVGSFKRIALTAANRVRRKKPFHAFEVSDRCAVPLIHVTTTDPFRARRHPDLVTHVVIANRRPDRMRAMTVVIARERRIIATRICNAVVNGVMPVVVVIGRDSIPAAVMRLQRVMRPTLTGISSADRDSLTPEPQRPDIRCVRVTDVGLNRLRSLRWRRPSAIASG